MTTERAGAPRDEVSTRPWNIVTRLTMAAAPAAAIALLLGGILIWQLIASDTAPGFTAAEIWALLVGALAVLAAAGTITAIQLAGRSISDGVLQVSEAARTVARKDLVDLLDALRDPDADLSSVTAPVLDIQRDDEVGELARSFGQLHETLVEVSARQMEALRRGVSSIFMTLARRNSSLVDRQLALLDELEAREEDPEILGGYYKLDHLATRMRRNAESLLVLAGSDSPRTWAKPTAMTDVVRAAIGEVDEYQRIEVVALEPAKLAGGAVSDVAHLLAELLENAIQFSPPSESVRVTGLFDVAGYTLTVSDRGVGIGEARITELNRTLAQPPALGLSVEPTMGMYVVAKLAHRHGLAVELVRGVPGVTANVIIPRDHLEVAERQEPRRWQAGRDEARTVTPDDGVFADPGRPGHVVIPSVADAASGNDVIDLTDPVFTDTHDAVAPLPVRTPGAAFHDEAEHESSAAAGQGAAGIRAALAAYDRGRRAAAAAEEWKFDQDVEEPT